MIKLMSEFDPIKRESSSILQGNAAPPSTPYLDKNINQTKRLSDLSTAKNKTREFVPVYNLSTTKKGQFLKFKSVYHVSLP